VARTRLKPDSRSPERALFVGATDAVERIRDDSVIAISGFNMATTPEHLILALLKRYVDSGHPKRTFIICDALPAVPGRAFDVVAKRLWKEKGQDLLRGMQIPFLGFSPWLQKLVLDERIEAYSWPIGVTAYWFREVASGRPGLLTRIGVDTLLDPRRQGGALNKRGESRRTCTARLMTVDDQEYLFYQAPKPQYALVRATSSDSEGNLTMEMESTKGTVVSITQATKARPGAGEVFAQVLKKRGKGKTDPRLVDVPGPLVDRVVLSPAKHQWQSGSTQYNPAFSYQKLPDIRGGFRGDVGGEPEPQTKAIARRVLLELLRLYREKRSPVVVNIGIGIPALLSSVALEEGVENLIVPVLETGQWGGAALSGVDFGVAISPFATSPIPDMFSNFEGGIIDAASLGFLQVDRHGNVNPAMLPGRIFGPGGFPVIAGGAPKIMFAGAFTSGEAKFETGDGRLKVVSDGKVKFVKDVYRIFFSGREASHLEKDILYVTERAVFRLTPEGILLEEVAPGVDLDKDVLAKMEFAPMVAPKLKEMDSVLFRKGRMRVAPGSRPA
jgi:propionate CoA-transferase